MKCLNRLLNHPEVVMNDTIMHERALIVTDQVREAATERNA